MEFSLDVQKITEVIEREKPVIIFPTSPNNPDESVIDEDVLLKIHDLAILAVLDEAYIEFSGLESKMGWVKKHENLIVLRTFSKRAGLAGLRVGYGAFPLSIIEYLLRAKQPYNVSVVAEVSACGIAESRIFGESNDGSAYMVYNRRGRVGVKGQDKLHGPYTSVQSALDEFEQKFYAKTKNCWLDRKDFVSHTKCYSWLAMDYNEAGKETVKHDDFVHVEEKFNSKLDIQPRETKLEARVAKFISLICNVSIMKHQMMEIGYNAEKLPLGKLSKTKNLKGEDINAVAIKEVKELAVVTSCLNPSDGNFRIENEYGPMKLELGAAACGFHFGYLSKVSSPDAECKDDGESEDDSDDDEDADVGDDSDDDAEDSSGEDDDDEQGDADSDSDANDDEDHDDDDDDDDDDDEDGEDDDEDDSDSNLCYLCPFLSSSTSNKECYSYGL